MTKLGSICKLGIVPAILVWLAFILAVAFLTSCNSYQPPGGGLAPVVKVVVR